MQHLKRAANYFWFVISSDQSKQNMFAINFLTFDMKVMLKKHNSNDKYMKLISLSQKRQLKI
jgi:hypothetical protein